MSPVRFLVVASLVLATMAGAGCVGPREVTDPVTGSPVDLGEVEVKEYKGEKLGSAADFRENSISGPQAVDLETYSLKVSGEVSSPVTLSYDEVVDRTTYEKIVTLFCVEGWNVKVLWEGVRLSDLLDEAGYDPAAKVVIFTCADGYTTSLPLDYVVERDILLAYRMNGIDLPTERGFPFQVVAEDKWGYKWAKWVTGIEVSNDTDYEGYWESRGYDNEGTLPEKK